jgi:hypothetical protein
MIDKFNFYDIYGYFLPGAAVILLLWLPFGLVHGDWPKSDLGSAVIGIIISYVAGHLLQMTCTRALPSTVTSGGRQRNPSDIVVDENDTNFGKDFKTNLAALVKKQFGLDLQVETTATEQIDRVRGDAFNLARHALQHTKEVSYAEQFQGMYTLTRGLTAGFALACVYYIGWALSIFHAGWVDVIAIGLITASLLAADNFTALLWKSGDKALERWIVWMLLLSTVCAGYLLGRHFHPTHIKAGILGVCAAGALAASFRCFMAYKSFSFSFAKTVWRDFYSSIDKEPPPANDPV